MKQNYLQKISDTKNYTATVALTFIVMVVISVYTNSLEAPFTFDDIPKIVQNPDIRELTNLQTKLIYPYSKELKTFYRNDPSRPLTYLTFMLNYHFGKLKPLGYHLLDLLVHLGNIILIFFLSRKIIFYVYKKKSTAFPFFVAFFFAVHPVQTNTVCYTFARSNNLATFFYILSILFFSQASEKNKTIYLFSLLSFILSLASKPIAVTLPAILLIFDYIFLADFKLERLALRKVYHSFFWIILFSYLIFRYFYLGGIGDIDPPTAPLYSSYTYLLTQTHIILKYFKLLFMLKGFCINHLIMPVKQISEPRMILPLLTLLCSALLSLKLYIKKTADSRIFLFCLLWFFITLSPTSSFFPTTNLMDDKRLYLPGFGFSLLIVSFYFLVFTKGNFVKKGIHWSLFLILGIHLSLLTGITAKRTRLYENITLLWEEAVTQYPNSSRSHNALGVLYDLAEEDDKARIEYQKALELNPNHIEAQANFASLYYDRKKYAQALKEYQKVMTIILKLQQVENKDLEQAVLHYTLARIYYAKKELDKALSECQKALKLNPDLIDAHHRLATIYKEQHDYRRAILQCKKILQKKPNRLSTRKNLAILYSKSQAYEKAITEYRQILSLKPDSVSIRHELATLLHKQKNYKQALSEYQKVIALDPKSGEAHNNLGLLYYEQNEFAKAFEEYQKALKIKPDLSDAHNNLGNLYYSHGENTQALAAYQKALEINPNLPAIHKNLGLVYHSQKKYQKALENFKIYLKSTPEDSAVEGKIKSIEEKLSYLTLSNG